ncbi:MAG: fibronectin type III domain-containing protein [Candidatus Gracilibacteria bacterium]|nr:fibronectin type III domain-containing protein [Candidatus Peregrinibacteria bacterium]
MSKHAKKQVMQHIALLAVTALALILALPIVRAQSNIIPESENVAQADTQAPSDVENVKATPGNGMITLTWDVATDNELVAGYKVYYGTTPVTEPGDEYEFEPVDVGNKITYEMTGLENGTTYYFAITAYDSSGNESPNYSVEASATPVHGAAGDEAPKVVSANVQDKGTVLVTFSEAVNLPASPASAFSIAEDGSGTALQVLSASMDLNDPTNKTVVLTTETQVPGQTYIVTAGIQVTDLDGNPIESGTSDTAIFTGTDQETPTEEETLDDTTGPELVNIQTPDATTVVVTFNEPVVLSPDPTQNFVITEESDSTATLAISAAALSADKTMVTLTTAEQDGMNYFLVVLDVADASGNLMDVANNAAAFTGFGMQEEQPTEETPVEEQPTEEQPVEETPTDTTAPEDATNFVAKLLSSMVVQLAWTPSLNTAGDLANYVLYKSTDGIAYGEGVQLGADASTYDLSGLSSGVKYYYKLAARDEAGNESEGITASFMLPETGPELAFLFGGSLGLGRFFTRKKKKKLARKA